MTTNSAIKLSFLTLDVFTTTKYLGNPLAVVLVPAVYRSSLSQVAKQRIAREFNLSETVFLHVPSESEGPVSTRTVDIFTIEEELPFAGHPIIGTASAVLHHFGWTSVNTLLAKAGSCLISIATSSAGTPRVRAAIPHAVYIHKKTLRNVLEPGHLSDGLSNDHAIREAELDAPVVSIVQGMTFVLVKLLNTGQLAKVNPGKKIEFGGLKGLLDEGEWEKSFVARYYYVDFGDDAVSGQGPSNRRLQSRMVELGFEDPATGSAACTLTSYLALSETKSSGAASGGSLSFEIAQGVEMGRKSDIMVEVVLENAPNRVQPTIKELYLGGSAVVVMEGSIEI